MDMIGVLRRAGRMEEAAEYFAECGVLVVAPSNHVIGRNAVKHGLSEISAQFPVFTVEARSVIQSGAVALHRSRWVAIGVGPMGEPIEVAGFTSDVLERQSDGRWQVLIDNPWAAEGLG
jgi:ketosteroid isomerase-like protein